jgi:coenzyme Q-binding protein COQ10
VLRPAVERLLPYPPEGLFDLAADVERYPEFLRWWIAARIRKREANVYYTDQVLGLGPIRLRFGSKTTLDRPKRIEVASEDAPFRRFRLSWCFDAQPNMTCRVGLAAEIELRSRLLGRIVDQALPSLIGNTIAAFEMRAAQRCDGSMARSGASRRNSVVLSEKSGDAALDLNQSERRTDHGDLR